MCYCDSNKGFVPCSSSRCLTLWASLRGTGLDSVRSSGRASGSGSCWQFAKGLSQRGSGRPRVAWLHRWAVLGRSGFPAGGACALRGFEAPRACRALSSVLGEVVETWACGSCCGRWLGVSWEGPSSEGAAQAYLFPSEPPAPERRLTPRRTVWPQAGVLPAGCPL